MLLVPSLKLIVQVYKKRTMYNVFHPHVVHKLRTISTLESDETIHLVYYSTLGSDDTIHVDQNCRVATM